MHWLRLFFGGWGALAGQKSNVLQTNDPITICTRSHHNQWACCTWDLLLFVGNNFVNIDGANISRKKCIIFQGVDVWTQLKRICWRQIRKKKYLKILWIMWGVKNYIFFLKNIPYYRHKLYSAFHSLKRVLIFVKKKLKLHINIYILHHFVVQAFIRLF